jgi:hypothetical protein
VVGVDDELRGVADEVGGVALPPGQGAGLGLQLTVDGLGGAGELDESVALDRGVAVDGLLGCGDLFVDAAQCASGPVFAELVVDDAVGDATGVLTAGSRPRLGQHQAVRNCLAGVLLAPLADHVGQQRDAGAQDVGQPRRLRATWLASEIIPASATTVTSASWWAALKALMTGSIVAVSPIAGRLPGLDCVPCTTPRRADSDRSLVPNPKRRYSGRRVGLSPT